MSALTEKLAQEHRHMISPRLRGHVCECHEWQQRGDGLFDEESFVAHIAEVTEAATRAAVAADIDTYIESITEPWSDRMSHYLGGMYDARDIAEGIEP